MKMAPLYVFIADIVSPTSPQPPTQHRPCTQREHRS
jgi:hypothetical protein